MAEYIERKIATNVVGDIDTTYPSDDKDDIVEKAIGRLDLIPAGDVAPVVHGRWEEGVEIQTDTSTLYDYTCSVCSIVTTRESPYCPNCGADMRGAKQ